MKLTAILALFVGLAFALTAASPLPNAKPPSQLTANRNPSRPTRRFGQWRKSPKRRRTAAAADESAEGDEDQDGDYSDPCGCWGYGGGVQINNNFGNGPFMPPTPPQPPTPPNWGQREFGGDSFRSQRFPYPPYPGAGNRPPYPGAPGNRSPYPGAGNRPPFPGAGERPQWMGPSRDQRRRF